jgi:hypothetical protein
MIVMEDGAARCETLKALDFDSEKQLEEVVCRYPHLLAREDDPPLSFISQQIQMSSGIMDVMMIDGDGLPVAVEVKLGRNAQARREIVGQLVDYVSTLTEYTVDELDELVSGKISDTIDAASKDEAERKKIWQTVGANLRAGLARYVLVLDEVPSELGRIVRFLAMRSNLDIRLVQISRYVSTPGQVFYMPRNLVEQVDSGTEWISSGGGTTAGQLQDVIDAYSRLPHVHPLRGKALRYRKIVPPAWPPTVHYEFQSRAKHVLVDIHLEGARVRHLASLLQSWETTPPAGFAHPLVWDPEWYGEGRVTVNLPPDSTPAEIAQAMVDLIAATENVISEALQVVSLR